MNTRDVLEPIAPVVKMAVIVPLSKSAVSKTINWSSSRYNTMKKSGVVDEVYSGMLNGGVWILAWKETYSDKWKTRDIEPLAGKPRIEYLLTEREYSSGSYCECSSMTRAGTYRVDYEEKTILSVEDGVLTTFIIKQELVK
jgi:hypothetical protein